VDLPLHGWMKFLNEPAQKIYDRIGEGLFDAHMRENLALGKASREAEKARAYKKSMRGSAADFEKQAKSLGHSFVRPEVFRFY
jgi:hypothetical protein